MTADQISALVTGLVALIGSLAGLVVAYGYAMKKRADAGLVGAEAKAGTSKAEVEVEKTEADTTGRIVTGREADIAELWKQIRKCQDDHAEGTRRCDEDRATTERRFAREAAATAAALATKGAEIDALREEIRTLRRLLKNASGRISGPNAISLPPTPAEQRAIDADEAELAKEVP